MSEPDEFRPTHQHAEGGLYELIGKIKYHEGTGLWLDVCLYRDYSGEYFTRRVADFESRFKPYPRHIENSSQPCSTGNNP